MEIKKKLFNPVQVKKWYRRLNMLKRKPVKAVLKRLVANHKDKYTVTELVILNNPLTQSEISRALADLREMDLVFFQKEGKWVYYKINFPRYLKLKAVITRLKDQYDHNA